MQKTPKKQTKNHHKNHNIFLYICALVNLIVIFKFVTLYFTIICLVFYRQDLV